MEMNIAGFAQKIAGSIQAMVGEAVRGDRKTSFSEMRAARRHGSRR
jgi:hypothetical protein